MNSGRLCSAIVGVAWVVLGAVGNCAFARDFTVNDAIEMTQFIDPEEGFGAVKFSPNGGYFSIVVERGLLDQNLVEDRILVWRTQAVTNFLHGERSATPPSPIEIARMTDENGPIISDLYWLDDSSGVMFLSKGTSHNDQLFMADIASRSVRALSTSDQEVTHFAAAAGNALYTASTLDSSSLQAAQQREDEKPSFVGTGRSLTSLLFPVSVDIARYGEAHELWAVVEGRRFKVDTSRFSQPVHLDRFSYGLSPDGRHAILSLPVTRVPEQWAQYQGDRVYGLDMSVKAGTQDLSGDSGFPIPHQYVLVDLERGALKPLLDAPDGDSKGYWHWDRANAAWSRDGRRIVIPSTFLPVDDSMSAQEREQRLGHPCIAVVEVETLKGTCIEQLKGSGENGLRAIKRVGFDPKDSDRIFVDYNRVPLDLGHGSEVYRWRNDGRWVLDNVSGVVTNAANALDVKVSQTLNNPPQLVAADDMSHASRVIFDPNPQLKTIDLGKASVLRWRDRAGRAWSGGLVTPPNYDPGRRYPIVLQTHGFRETEFISSGSYTSAFAARPLAAAGMLVLQLPDGCPERGTAEEVSCQIGGYEIAVQMLITRGLIDSQKIGIIGFSRTCIYTLSALTSSSIHFAAATINDGFTLSYLQYLYAVDEYKNYVAGWMNPMIGAPPFGKGLQEWMVHSPGFMVDKVMAPLRIEAVGRPSALFMWEPYAAMRYMNKPVDLIVLQFGTHPLSNPAQRLASQGGNVDWFRFWLQGYEDPDPAKYDQYVRWRGLRKSQVQEDAKSQGQFDAGSLAH